MEEIDIGGLSSYQQGNEFTGSKTKSRRRKLEIRFRVIVDKENNQLKAYRWTTDVCFDKAQDKEEMQAPITNEGVDAIRSWLWERYQEL